MTNPKEPLPAVDAAPGIASVVDAGGRAVVVAPPGTGKSTALPSALLDRLPGRIFVTQPRRLAARMLARRVASIRDVELGEEVGFATRTERREGDRTRLCYLTEGLLLRRMLGEHGPG
ncbi:MAG: ATP-dependent helicase HrpB, partial [Phycisphaeraceae bacterium]|nr:ATP-dependent helicase HrpB [Phycisphaeraceae bacterium]